MKNQNDRNESTGPNAAFYLRALERHEVTVPDLSLVDLVATAEDWERRPKKAYIAYTMQDGTKRSAKQLGGT